MAGHKGESPRLGRTVGLRRRPVQARRLDPRVEDVFMPIGPPFRSTNAPRRRRIGLLSTYPPELCGLATFAAALERALRDGGNEVDIVRINDRANGPALARPVAAELVNGHTSSRRRAVSALSRCDVAIVQHEYGIYGGPDGDEVLEVLGALRIPTIVVLHTVPHEPTVNQRVVLTAVTELADKVVVMSETARHRLFATYPIDRSKVIVIAHGASGPVLHACDEVDGSQPPRRQQLLTWGLLGPGKGIEHAIDAVALLEGHRATTRYTIAGVTHPKVLASQGDGYRRSLIERTERYGLSDVVGFDDTYRDVAQLTRFVASASLVVLPYDSREQVTSGVLVDAIAAGRPVIATAFPHAVELLSTGAGIIVPHADPAALANAIQGVLDDPSRLAAMAAAASGLAPSLSWPAVADRYVEVADELLAEDALSGQRLANLVAANNASMAI